jgi:hypothetical protein
MSLDEASEVTKFDFSVTFVYNSVSNVDRLSCVFECSQDLFDENTVKKMGRQYQHLLSQLFMGKCNMMKMEVITKPMRQLSLILPEEEEEVQELIFTHRSDTADEGMITHLFDSFMMSL